MERENHDFGAEAASLLQWWSDAGVDVVLDETPRDWLKPEPKRETAAPATSTARGDDALPDQLPLFRAWLAESDALPFAAPAAPRVCPAGDPASGLMIVTDMPTGEDCAAGTLIAGEAGRLFDRMLAAIGRTRETIYVAALSCLRSPDGRLAGAAVQQCATLARHHAGLVGPRAILIFGDAASKALLGLSVAQARGRWHEIATQAGPIKALVTLSPAHLLNHPKAKAHAWADLQKLIEAMKE
jgi:DNA polymerase